MTTILEATPRQQRIDRLGYRPQDDEMHRRARCPLCAHQSAAQVSRRDRYGFAVSSSLCMHCGLIYLDPCPSPQAYERFYARVFQPLICAFHGRPKDDESAERDREPYSEQLVRYFKSLGADLPESGGRLLDVGGGTGAVADRLTRAFGWQTTVLDPSTEDLARAADRGLATISGGLEQIDAAQLDRFEVITLCRTIDHLVDPVIGLATIARLLAPTGVFYFDIVDFRAVVTRHADVSEAIKIDHPLVWTTETARLALDAMGLSVLLEVTWPDGEHRGFFAAGAGRSKPDPIRPHPDIEELLAIVRMHREAYGEPVIDA